MRFKPMSEILPGDSFTYNGRNTEVREVDRDICKHKVHINKSDCYEAFTEVLVRERTNA